VVAMSKRLRRQNLIRKQSQMTTHNPPAERAEPRGGTVIGPTFEGGRGIIERYRDRAAARKSTRLVSARGRQVIARWLRRTANVAHDPHPMRRRQNLLLHTVPALFAASCWGSPRRSNTHATRTRRAWRNCTSSSPTAATARSTTPIHVSELHATLYAVRAGISPDRPRSGSTSPRPAVGHTSRPKLRRTDVSGRLDHFGQRDHDAVD
jgi:hypothetical protein